MSVAHLSVYIAASLVLLAPMPAQGETTGADERHAAHATASRSTQQRPAAPSASIPRPATRATTRTSARSSAPPSSPRPASRPTPPVTQEPVASPAVHTTLDTAVLFASSPVHPPFVPVERVRLTDLAIRMLQNNPRLRADSAAARAAAQRPSQAGALPDPRLGARLMSEVEQDVMVDPGGMVSVRDDRMNATAVSWSQMVPLGKLGPMSRLEERMAGRMNAEYRLEVSMTLKQLKESFIDLYSVDASAITLTRIQRILDLMTRGAEAMYRSGQGRQSDILRAQLEYSMLRDRLLMLEGRRTVVAADINQLIGIEASVPVNTPGELIPYTLDIHGVDEAECPAVAVAAAGLEAARAGVDVARSMFVPDIELMGEVILSDGRDAGWEVGAALTLPIWSAARQVPGLREAEARREEAEARSEAARLSASRDARSAIAMARTAAAQHALYENTIIPQARLALEASLAGYRSGTVDFMDVMSNLNAVLNYELGAIESTANFYRAVAMYEETSSRMLEWRTP